MSDPIRAISARGLIIQQLRSSGVVLAVWAEDDYDDTNHCVTQKLYYQLAATEALLDFSDGGPKETFKVVKNDSTTPPTYRTDPAQGIPLRVVETENGEIQVWIKSLAGVARGGGTLTAGEWEYDYLVATNRRVAGTDPCLGLLDWIPCSLASSPATDSITGNTTTRIQQSPPTVLDVCSSPTVNSVQECGTLCVEYERDDNGRVIVDNDGHPKVALDWDGVTPKIGTLVATFQKDYFGVGMHAWTGGAWDGTVTFMRSRNIAGPITPSGTPNVCIDITYEGDGAGTVVYCDGSQWASWPEHHIILKVSQLPSGTFPVW